MNLLIAGISGIMGQKIYKLATEDNYWSKVEGVDEKNPFDTVQEVPSVVIDFSHPTALQGVLKYCVDNKVPLVIGTTGFEAEEQQLIEKASKTIPILQATNMSLGMNIMFSLVEQVASILKDKVDIEVVEAHHNRKKDAPSGSATTIIESIEKGLGETRKHVHGREGQCPREKGEIGVHAIRGGNIVGLHEASFIHDLETIKITHEAYDRSVFAQGALEAAKFLIGKENRIYNMKDVLGLK
ncbi:4-hydroxy-tetrahydrodipicolinate reductase [Clostridium formicaceticum]|uniref:4-hydroxy-tetrahydrodipicolinate reductase n=1 Tax=Clostridium formicaceticum TaxID=1497 RepID=A0AAC9WGF9_9CLOT|nr:4-hydroxy-tetrahydrodipicolinate reductase [Clostridium formicaceticum]AOY76298.1 4-hydroxy-tetrahydrodipicolinate reductase [Clostridium formicaceticum]ARE86685.1 4-hydroxy-tetrahydrodipicolinate reductase [Clostridium formicaceticum]